jgi:hypothetical protein
MLHFPARIQKSEQAAPQPHQKDEREMPPKRPKGKGPEEADGAVNFALKKLRDGREGRAGSIDEVLGKVHELERAVKKQPAIRKTLVDLNLTEAYREVVDLPGGEAGGFRGETGRKAATYMSPPLSSD